MAFGDNLNDLEMIQEAGIGVAMAAAPAALQLAASETTVDIAGFLRSRFAEAMRTEGAV